MDPCIFSGFPLDPADHLRGDENWIAGRLSDPKSRFLSYYQGRPLMDISAGLSPVFASHSDISDKDWVFIGLNGDVAVFAVALNEKPDLPDAHKFIDLRSIALQVSAGRFSDMPSLLARGKMLLEWQGRRHFCSCCGHQTKSINGGYVRECLNEACAAEHFPRTDPVVIMLVTDGDRCLLGRAIDWPEGNYSALAGFMEPGETIEEAARREVHEETGIKVGRVTYIKSQPWPFPSSLMIGLLAEALTSDITINDELADAKWVEKDHIRQVLETGGDGALRAPPEIAIARHLLQEWVE